MYITMSDSMLLWFGSISWFHTVCFQEWCY